MITAFEAAQRIDISAVRTQHTMSDMLELVELAKKYHFINVHVLPSWVATIAPLVRDIEGVYVGSPIGFPSGGHNTETKVIEALELIKDGAQEIDVMMNIGKLKNREYKYVERELKTIVNMIGDQAITKVIIEINALTDEEMLTACSLVMDSGAAFVKTGTGWIAGNANLERVAKIKKYCGNNIKVKAAGGIRTKEEFLQLWDMGVERMGINTKSAVQIVESL